MTAPNDTASGASSRATQIRWDEERDEPYLPIPGFSAPELRLTPFRKGDDKQWVALNNDPAVGIWSYLRPYPFLPEHMSFIWENMYPGQRKTIDLLRPLLSNQATAGQGSTSNPSSVSAPPFIPTPAFPFAVIRDGDRIAGHISLFDSAPPPPPVSEETQQDGRQQVDEPAGAQPAVVEPQWELAYDVAEPYRGKGLMGSALRAVVESWAKWVGIRTVHAKAQTKNAASEATLRKLGFQRVSTSVVDWPAYNGGGQRESGRWELEV